jgi:rhodanese-related sulfurtransferase
MEDTAMSAKTVDAVTLKRWLDMEEAVLVDVREPGEHAAESIQGAALVPLGSASASKIPTLNGKKLVIHCKKGGRGEKACAALQAQLPSAEIYNLEGGIESWAQAGLPVRR